MLGMLTFRLCLLSKPVSPEKTFLPSRISDSRSGLQTYEKYSDCRNKNAQPFPDIIRPRANVMPGNVTAGHVPAVTFQLSTVRATGPQACSTRPSGRMRKHVPPLRQKPCRARQPIRGTRCRAHRRPPPPRERQP